MKTAYSWETAPFASYTLTNNNACLKNTLARLERIKKAKEKPTNETENINQYFAVMENTDIMRLQLKFEGKPSEEIRNILKSKGFKWSPTNMMWQRQLTYNAKCAVQYVLDEISKLNSEQL